MSESYYSLHKDEYKKRCLEYYHNVAKHKPDHKEKTSKYNREYYQKNKDLLQSRNIEYRREYLKKNIEKIREYQKEYREKNRERINEQKKEAQRRRRGSVKVYKKHGESERYEYKRRYNNSKKKRKLAEPEYVDSIKIFFD